MADDGQTILYVDGKPKVVRTEIARRHGLRSGEDIGPGLLLKMRGEEGEIIEAEKVTTQVAEEPVSPPVRIAPPEEEDDG